MAAVKPSRELRPQGSAVNPAGALDVQLSPAEMKAILAVIDRDDKLRKEETMRVSLLKAELQQMRRQGALRSGVDPDRTCARCRLQLGRVINRGAPCRSCHARVCKTCRRTTGNGQSWVCTVCHKQLEIQLATGQWMNTFVRRPSRRRERQVAPSTQLRRQIRRSWTLSNPAEAGRSAAEARALQARQRLAAGHPAGRPHPRPVHRPENRPRRELHRPTRRATMTSADRVSRSEVTRRRPYDLDSVSSGVSSITSSPTAARRGRMARRGFHGSTPILDGTASFASTPVLGRAKSHHALHSTGDRQRENCSDAELDSWRSSTSSETSRQHRSAPEPVYANLPRTTGRREIEGGDDAVGDEVPEIRIIHETAADTGAESGDVQDQPGFEVNIECASDGEDQRHYDSIGSENEGRQEGAGSETHSRRGSLDSDQSAPESTNKLVPHTPRRNKWKVGSLRRLIEERRRSSAVSALSEGQICLREDAKSSEQDEPAGPPDGSPRSGSRRSSVSSEAEARARPTGGSDPGSEEESFGGVIFKRLTSLARRRTIANRQAHSQPESSGSGQRSTEDHRIIPLHTPPDPGLLRPSGDGHSSSPRNARRFPAPPARPRMGFDGTGHHNGRQDSADPRITRAEILGRFGQALIDEEEWKARLAIEGLPKFSELPMYGRQECWERTGELQQQGRFKQCRTYADDFPVAQGPVVSHQYGDNIVWYEYVSAQEQCHDVSRRVGQSSVKWPDEPLGFSHQVSQASLSNARKSDQYFTSPRPYQHQHRKPISNVRTNSFNYHGRYRQKTSLTQNTNPRDNDVTAIPISRRWSRPPATNSTKPSRVETNDQSSRQAGPKVSACGRLCRVFTQCGDTAPSPHRDAPTPEIVAGLQEPVNACGDVDDNDRAGPGASGRASRVQTTADKLATPAALATATISDVRRGGGCADKVRNTCNVSAVRSGSDVPAVGVRLVRDRAAGSAPGKTPSQKREEKFCQTDLGGVKSSDQKAIETSRVQRSVQPVQQGVNNRYQVRTVSLTSQRSHDSPTYDGGYFGTPTETNLANISLDSQQERYRNLVLSEIRHRRAQFQESGPSSESLSTHSMTSSGSWSPLICYNEDNWVRVIIGKHKRMTSSNVDHASASVKRSKSFDVSRTRPPVRRPPQRHASLRQRIGHYRDDNYDNGAPRHNSAAADRPAQSDAETELGCERGERAGPSGASSSDEERGGRRVAGPLTGTDGGGGGGGGGALRAGPQCQPGGGGGGTGALTCAERRPWSARRGSGREPGGEDSSAAPVYSTAAQCVTFTNYQEVFSFDSVSLSNLSEVAVDSEMEEENRKNAALAGEADGSRLIESHVESKVDDSDSDDESTCEYDLLAAAARFEIEHRRQATESESSTAVDTTRSEDSESTDSDTHVRQTYVLNASSSIEDLLDSGRDSPLTVDSTPIIPETVSEHDDLNSETQPLQQCSALQDKSELVTVATAAGEATVTAAAAGGPAPCRTVSDKTGSAGAAAAPSGPVLATDPAANSLAAGALTLSPSHTGHQTMETGTGTSRPSGNAAGDSSGNDKETAPCLPAKDPVEKQTQVCDSDGVNAASASDSDKASGIGDNAAVESSVSSEPIGLLSVIQAASDAASVQPNRGKVVAAVVPGASEVGASDSARLATGGEGCAEATDRDAAVRESCATDGAAVRDGNAARELPPAAEACSESRTKSGPVKSAGDVEAASDGSGSVPTESVAQSNQVKDGGKDGAVSEVVSGLDAVTNELIVNQIDKNEDCISRVNETALVPNALSRSAISESNDTTEAENKTAGSGSVQLKTPLDTEEQNPPTTVEPVTEEQSLPTTVEPDIEEQSPPTTVEPDTEEQSPPTTVEPDTKEQSPPTTVEPDTKEQSPPTTVEPDTEEQSPPTTTEPETKEQGPSTTLELATKEQSPPTTTEPETKEQGPSTTVELATKEQSPPTTVEPDTEEQSPPTEQSLPTTVEPVIAGVRDIARGEAKLSSDLTDLTAVVLTPPITTEVKGDLAPLAVGATSVEDRQSRLDLSTNGHAQPAAEASAAGLAASVNPASTPASERTVQEAGDAADSAELVSRAAPPDREAVPPGDDLSVIDGLERPLSPTAGGDAATPSDTGAAAAAESASGIAAAPASIEMSESLTGLQDTAPIEAHEQGDLVNEISTIKVEEETDAKPKKLPMEVSDAAEDSSEAHAATPAVPDSGPAADDSTSGQTTSAVPLLVDPESGSESHDASKVSQEVHSETAVSSPKDITADPSPACQDSGDLGVVVSASAVFGPAPGDGRAPGRADCSGAALPPQPGTATEPVSRATVAAGNAGGPAAASAEDAERPPPADAASAAATDAAADGAADEAVTAADAFADAADEAVTAADAVADAAAPATDVAADEVVTAVDVAADVAVPATDVTAEVTAAGVRGDCDVAELSANGKDGSSKHPTGDSMAETGANLNVGNETMKKQGAVLMPAEQSGGGAEASATEADSKDQAVTTWSENHKHEAATEHSEVRAEKADAEQIESAPSETMQTVANAEKTTEGEFRRDEVTEKHSERGTNESTGSESNVNCAAQQPECHGNETAAEKQLQATANGSPTKVAESDTGQTANKGAENYALHTVVKQGENNASATLAQKHATEDAEKSQSLNSSNEATAEQNTSETKTVRETEEDAVAVTAVDMRKSEATSPSVLQSATGSAGNLVDVYQSNIKDCKSQTCTASKGTATSLAPAGGGENTAEVAKLSRRSKKRRRKQLRGKMPSESNEPENASETTGINAAAGEVKLAEHQGVSPGKDASEVVCQETGLQVQGKEKLTTPTEQRDKNEKYSGNAEADKPITPSEQKNGNERLSGDLEAALNPAPVDTPGADSGSKKKKRAKKRAKKKASKERLEASAAESSTTGAVVCQSLVEQKTRSPEASLVECAAAAAAGDVDVHLAGSPVCSSTDIAVAPSTGHSASSDVVTDSRDNHGLLVKESNTEASDSVSKENIIGQSKTKLSPPFTDSHDISTSHKAQSSEDLNPGVSTNESEVCQRINSAAPFQSTCGTSSGNQLPAKTGTEASENDHEVDSILGVAKGKLEVKTTDESHPNSAPSEAVTTSVGSAITSEPLTDHSAPSVNQVSNNEPECEVAPMAEQSAPDGDTHQCEQKHVSATANAETNVIDTEPIQLLDVDSTTEVAEDIASTAVPDDKPCMSEDVPVIDQEQSSENTTIDDAFSMQGNTLAQDNDIGSQEAGKNPVYDVAVKSEDSENVPAAEKASVSAGSESHEDVAESTSDELASEVRPPDVSEAIEVSPLRLESPNVEEEATSQDVTVLEQQEKADDSQDHSDSIAQNNESSVIEHDKVCNTDNNVALEDREYVQCQMEESVESGADAAQTDLGDTQGDTKSNIPDLAIQEPVAACNPPESSEEIVSEQIETSATPPALIDESDNFGSSAVPANQLTVVESLAASVGRPENSEGSATDVDQSEHPKSAASCHHNPVNSETLAAPIEAPDKLENPESPVEKPDNVKNSAASIDQQGKLESSEAAAVTSEKLENYAAVAERSEGLEATAASIDQPQNLESFSGPADEFNSPEGSAALVCPSEDPNSTAASAGESDNPESSTGTADHPDISQLPIARVDSSGNSEHSVPTVIQSANSEKPVAPVEKAANYEALPLPVTQSEHSAHSAANADQANNEGSCTATEDKPAKVESCSAPVDQPDVLENTATLTEEQASNLQEQTTGNLEKHETAESSTAGTFQVDQSSPIASPAASGDTKTAEEANNLASACKPNDQEVKPGISLHATSGITDTSMDVEKYLQVDITEKMAVKEADTEAEYSEISPEVTSTTADGLLETPESSLQNSVATNSDLENAVTASSGADKAKFELTSDPCTQQQHPSHVVRTKDTEADVPENASQDSAADLMETHILPDLTSSENAQNPSNAHVVPRPGAAFGDDKAHQTVVEYGSNHEDKEPEHAVAAEAALGNRAGAAVEERAVRPADRRAAAECTESRADEIRDAAVTGSPLMVTESPPVQAPAAPESLAARDGSGGAGAGKTRYNGEPDRLPAPAGPAAVTEHEPAGQDCRGDGPAAESAADRAGTPDTARCGAPLDVSWLPSRAQETSSTAVPPESEVTRTAEHTSGEDQHCQAVSTVESNPLVGAIAGESSEIENCKQVVQPTDEAVGESTTRDDDVISTHGNKASAPESTESPAINNHETDLKQSEETTRCGQTESSFSPEQLSASDATTDDSGSGGGASCGAAAGPVSTVREVTPLAAACESDRPAAGGGADETGGGAAPRGFVSVVAVGAAGSTVVHTACDGQQRSPAAPVTVTTPASQHAVSVNSATVEVGSERAATAADEEAPSLPQALADSDGPPPAPSEEVEVVTDDKTNSVLVSGRGVGGGSDERPLHGLIARSRSAQDEFVQMSVSAETAPCLADYFAGLDSPSPGLSRRSPRTPEIRHCQLSSGSAESASSAQLPHISAPDDFDDGFDFGGGEKDEYTYDHFDSDERYSMEEPESMSDTSREEEGFQDEDLRGNSRPIDFTLTTIIEESCEDSDSEGRSSKERTPTVDPSELEKYFFYDIGDGRQEPPKSLAEESEYSDTSFSEMSQSFCTTDALETDDPDTDPVDQAASRYFNKGFTCGLHRQPSIRSAGDDSEVQTDGSGSVGSDSEGQPSPEQRRKKVTRSRFRAQSGDVSGSSGGEGTARETSEQSGGSSSDDDAPPPPVEGGDESAFEKTDGQFDTIKRRKKKKAVQPGSDHSDREALSEKSARASEDAVSAAASTVAAVAAVTAAAAVAASTADVSLKQADTASSVADDSSDLNQLDKTGEARQSRDSGFLGSSDDLLKESVIKESEGKLDETADQADRPTPNSSDGDEKKKNLAASANDASVSPPVKERGPVRRPTSPSSQADTSSEAIGAVASSPSMKNRNKVIRKDSFNNWSSDEETNILMGRLRQFFRANILNGPRGDDFTPGAPAPKPAQLVSFENELTRMMKSVPGIKEAQVREIVEYLSSEDTWSDSYDSSDYTSSDLEGAYAAFNPSQPDFITQIQKQISHSCQQIIQKYDASDLRPPPPPEPPKPSMPSPGHSNDAVAVYERLMGSLRGLSAEATTEPPAPPVPASPPMFAKVMQHVGQRLVALMHEVSSGGDSTSLSDNSPNMSVHLPRARDFFNESYTSSPKLRGRVSRADPTSSPDITPGHSPTVPRGGPGRNSGRSGYHRLMTAPPAASDDNILASLETTASPTGPRKSIGSSGSIDFNKILRDSKRKKKKEFDSCHNLVEQKDTEEEPNLGRAEDKWTRLSGRVKSEGDVSVKSCGSGSTLTIGRPRSSEFSSSEQVDSDSTLRAADSYDKHIGQRSTPRWFSSRSSLGSKNSLNTSLSSETITARPEASDSEPEDKKPRRFLFQYRRRSSVPDTSAVVDPDVRSTTLPRSTAGAGNTGAPSTPTVAGAGSSLSLPRGRVTPPHKAVHLGVSSLAADSARSARYRPPGYRAAGPTSRKTSLLGARRSSWSHKDEASAGGGGRAAESPLAARSSSTLDRRSVSSLPISEPDDDIDRLVAIHQQRSSTLSTLGSRSDSLASVYSAGEARYGTVPVRGELELALQYNYQASALEVSVKQCRDLAAVDTKRNRSDPYVKAYLLPDRSKSGKRKTKTKKHTLHPVFEEVLKFPAAVAELESRTLWVTVWHSDIFGRNDFLGEVVLPVSRQLFEDTSPRWYTLQERSEIQEEMPGHRGDVIVALKYTPPDGSLGRKGRKTRGRLHVMVKEAKNLAPVRSNGSADPFCKCYLLPDRKSSKQKTPVVKRTTCPRWSGALTYDSVSLGELRERALELTIWDHSITSNEFLGGARFNLGTGKQQGRLVEWMDAVGQEVALWEQMIERPGYWVEGSVPLRCSMERAVPPEK